MFAQPHDGLALIHRGPIVARDFDDEQAYHQWATRFPELAQRLPTSRTARGFHIFFDCPHATFRKHPDGELRAGPKCYTILPPSCHPTGCQYSWIIPPTNPIPEIDLEGAGLATGFPQSNVLLSCDDYNTILSNDNTHTTTLYCSVETALYATLPSQKGERNRKIFDFAFQLRRLMPNASFNELRPIVERWHQLALPHVTTKNFETTWQDFCVAWPRLYEPKPKLTTILAGMVTPDEIAGRTDLPIRKLAAVCQALQRHAGPKPFFLSTRKAADLIGTSHTYAGRLIRFLLTTRILELVSKAGPPSSRQAPMYRMIPERTECPQNDPRS